LRARIADQKIEVDNLTAFIAQSQQMYHSAITGLHAAQHSSNGSSTSSSSSALQQQTDSSIAAMDTA
jgi:hypothetical protein